ncbi:receptor 12 [Olea europaea subsp. europaea]|uniref:Receptor 12 n=1 Tax=Olea europaea subsp. europaea TaxID=158383 RepID=A0A8S0QDK4_OLEEU|nr:receptor 12 [Olea europaea subsp. europaea]
MAIGTYVATACDRPSSLGAVIIFIPLIVSVRLPAIMIVPWDIVRRHKREINNQTPSEYSLDEVKYRVFTSKYASRKVQQIGYGYQNEGAASILTSCLISNTSIGPKSTGQSTWPYNLKPPIQRRSSLQLHLHLQYSHLNQNENSILTIVFLDLCILYFRQSQFGSCTQPIPGGSESLLNSSLTTKLVSGQCLDDQRSLLIQFKNSIIFDPTISVKLVTWNQSEDCCTWKGIACDSSGHVISLELDNESIYGRIENSTSLLGFQYLEKLNLAYNRLYDQIPEGIYNLANLTCLNLSYAGFVGQIPIEVSRMTRLVTLDLSTDNLDLFRFYSDANFSSRTWQMKLENPNLKTLVQNLKELRELYLDGVNISTPGSEWCQALSSSLPSLSKLSLSNCFLSGPLDSSLSQLQNLSFLRLDGNNLSTTIPYSFANFPKLTTLSMFSCSLQGFFPEKIFQLPTLQYLDLGNNNLLHGYLPQFHWGGSLREISLSSTNFSGSLPDSIGNLGMLSWIDLMDCKFTGLLPLFNMAKKLTHIDLSSNGLTGSLSSMHFEGLNDLEYIDLSHNSLNGSIPPALFALPSLQKLKLSNKWPSQ